MDIPTTAHILVTPLCIRDCKYCCNKQYNLNEIPYITDEELLNAKHVYITGGEPFLFSNPCMISYMLKKKYPNIERVVVYTNATELCDYLNNYNLLYSIDGLTISIKNWKDKEVFEKFLSFDSEVLKLRHNRLYVFPGYEDTKCPDLIQKMNRVWQKEFVPAPNSIFRKLETVL